MHEYVVITNTNDRSEWVGSNPRLYLESLITWEVWQDGNLMGSGVVEPRNWRSSHAVAAHAAMRECRVPVTAEHRKIGQDFIQ